MKNILHIPAFVRYGILKCINSKKDINDNIYFYILLCVINSLRAAVICELSENMH